jgi:predicted dehydrogenase
MNLTEEQRTIGRRNFLKAAAALPAAGAFVYSAALRGGPLRVGFVGTGNEGRVLLNNADPAFINVAAVADVFPVNRAIALQLARSKFNPDAKAYADYRELLAGEKVEAIITACPLHMHFPVVMDALNAGKHVLCEKLMAYSEPQCRQMIELADKKGLVLQIGHQRHYSSLYHRALEVIHAPDGPIGEVHHIRAKWHRNTKWNRKVPGSADDVVAMFKQAAAEVNNPRFTAFMLPTGDAARVRSALTVSPGDAAVLLAESQKVDYRTAGNGDSEKLGYADMDRLLNWRLYRRTSQGLMAELGSHQMDACGLLLGNALPTQVHGMGHVVNKDGREVYDHVYVHYEYPKDVVVAYSSITTNRFDNYGEIVFGTKGTMIIEAEQDVLLFSEGGGKTTEITPAVTRPGGATVNGSPSEPDGGGGPARASADPAGKAVSRGYMEEIQHFAVCCRSDGREKPRCDGRKAMADAIIALKANEAIDTGTRITFDPKSFHA